MQTNNANIITEKPTATRHVIIAMFNAGIATLDGSREATRSLRQSIVIHAEHVLGLTEAAAASAYNHARQQACATELVVREARGVLKPGPAYVAKNSVQASTDGDKWLIVDKATGKTVGTAESRRKAYKAKDVNQKVVKKLLK